MKTFLVIAAIGAGFGIAWYFYNKNRQALALQTVAENPKAFGAYAAKTILDQQAAGIIDKGVNAVVGMIP